jgi:hypothetical protein
MKMMSGIETLRDADQAILTFDVSDDALERAGGSGKNEAANPTLPSALVCIPFGPQSLR